MFNKSYEFPLFSKYVVEQPSPSLHDSKFYPPTYATINCLSICSILGTVLGSGHTVVSHGVHDRVQSSVGPLRSHPTWHALQAPQEGDGSQSQCSLPLSLVYFLIILMSGLPLPRTVTNEVCFASLQDSDRCFGLDHSGGMCCSQSCPTWWPKYSLATPPYRVVMNLGQ